LIGSLPGGYLQLLLGENLVLLVADSENDAAAREDTETELQAFLGLFRGRGLPERAVARPLPQLIPDGQQHGLAKNLAAEDCQVVLAEVFRHFLHAVQKHHGPRVVAFSGCEELQPTLPLPGQHRLALVLCVRRAFPKAWERDQHQRDDTGGAGTSPSRATALTCRGK
jgi:predicted Zn-dependent protease with MMP-like domain